LAYDSSFNFYVADQGTNRVLKFDLTSGDKFVGWLGKCVSGSNCDVTNEKSNGFSCIGLTCTKGPSLNIGNQDGQFSSLSSIAFDSSDNLYVADIDKVQKFDSSGNFLGWIGGCTGGSNCDVVNQRSNGFTCTDDTCDVIAGAGDGQFNANVQTSIDDNDNLYASDSSNKVQKFDSSGNFLGWIGGCFAGTNCDIVNQRNVDFTCTSSTCTLVSFMGQFTGIRDLYITASKLYVSDVDNVQVYSLPSNDLDMDGIPDGTDNCVNDANPGQEDHDNDMKGDVCDPNTEITTNTVATDTTFGGDLTVDGATFTIPSGITIEFDFVNNKIIIKNPSGKILIEFGGKIT